MKAFLLLVIGLSSGFYFGRVSTTDGAKEKLIKEGKIGLAMSQDQVRKSLGSPVATAVVAPNKERWTYPTQALVFGHGRLIGVEPVRTAPINSTATEPPQHSGNYVTTRLPNGSYQTRELAPGTSHLQSIGGGDYGGPRPTPTPASGSVIRDQWGWKQGSALDQRPR